MRTNLRSIESSRGAAQKSPRHLIFSEESQVIGAHADYRREDYMFQREQSLAMRGLEWDHRLKPMRHWAPNFVANLIFA